MSDMTGLHVRSKIIKVPDASPGLIFINGQQKEFRIENMWKSPVAPAPNMNVDVDLDSNGTIVAVSQVPDAQIAREQAEVALKGATEKGKKLWASAVAAAGLPNLVAGILLFISWIFLTATSMQGSYGGQQDYTFWQVLGLLNASNLLEAVQRNTHPSAGIYGFLALVCLLAPFAYVVWKDKRAHLGGVAPLLFMIIVAIMFRSSLGSAVTGGATATGAYREAQKQVIDEFMKTVSLGFGAYLGMLISLYFAGVGTMKFLGAKPGGLVTERPQKLAA
ncbi:MAG TPA: hypothetical protein VFO39_20160 [Candidatus Sulfotelmatobacter sp.]|nr:hypothetical protein [Candidatus Sulfotelmatobacter sp.]